MRPRDFFVRLGTGTGRFMSWRLRRRVGGGLNRGEAGTEGWSAGGLETSDGQYESPPLSTSDSPSSRDWILRMRLRVAQTVGGEDREGRGSGRGWDMITVGDGALGTITSDMCTVRRGGCSMRNCGGRRSTRMTPSASNGPPLLNLPELNDWCVDAKTCSRPRTPT